MTPEHANELKALQASLDEAFAELDELNKQLGPPGFISDPGFHAEVLRRFEFLDRQAEAIARRIYKIKFLYEGV